MNKLILGQRGFTLVETLLSVAILVMVVTAMFSALYVGQTSFVAMTKWGDQSQQLRVAMKQMTDDFAHTEYFGTDPYYDVTILAPQPKTGNTWDPSLAAWPGDLTDWPYVYVSYKIRGGTLIRDVADEVGQVSSMTLVADLESDSYLRPDNSNAKVVHVLLRRKVTGGSRIAEVRSDFYLR